MILADTATTGPLSETIWVPFDGISAVLVAFVLYCRIHPELVKNRAQYNAAFMSVLVIILFGTVRMVAYNISFLLSASGLITGLAQFVGIMMAVMSTGGVSLGEITGEMKQSLSDIRQGPDSKKPIIVPLTGAQPKAKDDFTESESVPRIRIDLSKPTPPDRGTLPLE